MFYDWQSVKLMHEQRIEEAQRHNHMAEMKPRKWSLKTLLKRRSPTSQ